jgi:hypothetical protein
VFWMGLWVAIAVVISLVVSIFADGPPAPVVALILGGFPLYYFLCLFTNSTRFLLDEDQVQVRTGPLWFWGQGHVTLDTPDVEAIYWELDEDNDEDDDSYTVYARLRDGGRKKLFEGILKRDAEFIAQELNAGLYELETGDYDYDHLMDDEAEDSKLEANNPTLREFKA